MHAAATEIGKRHTKGMMEEKQGGKSSKARFESLTGVKRGNGYLECGRNCLEEKRGAGERLGMI